jgi:hypothetical protein
MLRDPYVRARHFSMISKRSPTMHRKPQALMLVILLLLIVGLGIYISSLETLKNLRWDFIGSLIGAAGTIFAGWLAFSAV